jgi:hypothetical protein
MCRERGLVFSPETVHIDFEMAMHNSVRRNFRQANEEEFRPTFKRAVDKNVFDLVGKTFQICSTRKDNNACFPRISSHTALVFVCQKT